MIVADGPDLDAEDLAMLERESRLPEGDRRGWYEWRGLSFRFVPTYYKPCPNPLSFMDRARHHTTSARGKAKRFIDQYWFVHVDDSTSYRELAYSNAIPDKKTMIPPPFLPRLKRLNGRKRERYCRWCNSKFECKRIDAEYCSPRCKKAANRAGKR
jgi:hypothetical protein